MPPLPLPTASGPPFSCAALRCRCEWLAAQARQDKQELQHWLQQGQSLLRGFKIDALPLGDFLLPAECPILRLRTSEAASPMRWAHGERGVAGKCPRTSMVDHLHKYGEASLKWPPEILAARAAAVARLPTRQQEFVHYLYETNSMVSGEQMSLAEVNMSIGWANCIVVCVLAWWAAVGRGCSAAQGAGWGGGAGLAGFLSFRCSAMPIGSRASA